VNFRLDIQDLTKPENVKKLMDAISEIADKVDIGVVTVAPNGVTGGRKGKVVLYDTGSGFETWQNTDGATAWVRIDQSAVVATDPTKIEDDDQDTGIESERTSDDDILYGKTAGTDRWIITANGERTLPTQPAFSVINSGSQDNIATGGVTVVLATEVYDIGSNFDSNAFTAPVTGKYHLNAYVLLANIDTAADSYQLSLVTSNRTYIITIDPGQFAGDISGQWAMVIGILADMDANDTVTVQVTQNGGTVQTDIQTTVFTGYLAT